MSTPQDPDSPAEHRPRHAKPEPSGQDESSAKPDASARRELSSKSDLPRQGVRRKPLGQHERPEVSYSAVDEPAEQSSSDEGQSEVTFSIFDTAPTSADRRAEDKKPQRPAVSYSLSDAVSDTAPDARDVPGDHKHPERPQVDYGGLPSDNDDTDSGTPGRQTWSMVAFVFATIALLLFPIIFGVLGIGFGLYAHKKGEKLGYWSAIAALTSLLAGLAIRIYFFDAALIPEQD
ncbi:hypothetical protein ACFWU5_17950 [Nocardia sp. NPDC058640]|uniref:hypothetical protein n=1 Tax=Nocardia sp. NPDC058640 TaxID=3346571 RepID=UPI003649A8C3